MQTSAYLVAIHSAPSTTSLKTHYMYTGTLTFVNMDSYTYFSQFLLLLILNSLVSGMASVVQKNGSTVSLEISEHPQANPDKPENGCK